MFEISPGAGEGEETSPTRMYYSTGEGGRESSPTRMYLMRERMGRGGEGFIYNFQRKTNICLFNKFFFNYRATNIIYVHIYTL